jgi:16S rRNA pseudouridine516 synthase
MPPSNLRRLDQLLANLGYTSRRGAKDFLKQNEVLVDGVRQKQPAQKVEPTLVTIDGEPLDHPEGLLILLHKPEGYVCSHDAREGPSVYELLPARWLERNPRPETIGRLDKDTTGVLLLTDDGQLNHRWTSPQHQVDKVYEVTVDKDLDAALIDAFASGDLLLEGEAKPCQPARLEIVDATHARLVLTEGKYHQVKRMFAHFGFTVTALHRSAFGAYTVEGMEPGEWRVVSTDCD